VNGLLLDLMAASHRRAIDVYGQDVAGGSRPSLRDGLCGKHRLSLLAEFKRCSPSDSNLQPLADLSAQLRSYEQAGAAGVSVLTEPTRFGGSLADLRLAVALSHLPMLRKDFLVRPEQVRESLHSGASAVLLIARCLPGDQLHELVIACREAAVEMLIECHDELDLERALPFGDAMIGINNRDLDTLHIDRDVFLRLAPKVPSERVVVAESGYLEPVHLDPVIGLADAVLIGSALMRGVDAAGFSNRSDAVGDRS
tara:strand:+ start:110743 stop:111507 length:765 start_codon:yes stop_codon:yes gene_type:complete